MADILQDLPINVSIDRVYRAVSTPAGLDTWWTRGATGSPQAGAEYQLDFGPGYAWRARVTRCVENADFELEMMEADDDWQGTRVRLQLEPRGDGTLLKFRHTGWPDANDHYRTSCHCWAMYLRILRRSLEHGESVPYECRLDV